MPAMSSGPGGFKLPLAWAFVRRVVSSHEKRKVSGLVSGLIECLPVDNESLSLQNLAVMSFLLTESERPCKAWSKK